MALRNDSFPILWITRESLRDICAEVVRVIDRELDTGQSKIHRNIVDPVSAAFEMMYYGMDAGDWLRKESGRQVQKTMQNSIGEMHQKILGSVAGWKALDPGSGLDIVSHNKKIIAEVKNKHNTTKGNHKVKVYDDINDCITSGIYQGYTGCYVTVLAKKRINRPFTPTQNKKKRPRNESIREIDGRSFYEMVTGDKNALENLFKALPLVLGDILGKDSTSALKDEIFLDIIRRALPE